jgi:hypothetical protein
MNGDDGLQTVYLYINNRQATDSPGYKQGVFRYRLPNPIQNVVASDLVSLNMAWDIGAPPPPMLSICSSALGSYSVVSYSPDPLSLGTLRAWRVVLPELVNPSQDTSRFMFYTNKRLEYTPVGQRLLQDIDIQLLDYLGRPIDVQYSGNDNSVPITVNLVVALKVRGVDI